MTRAVLAGLLTAAVCAAAVPEAPSGLWPTDTGPELRLCPGPRDYGSAGTGGLKLAQGCTALAAGVWRPIDVDRAVYVRVAGLTAEVAALRDQLATEREAHDATRSRDAAALQARALELRIAASAARAPCPVCDCHELSVGLTGCAACAVGAAGVAWGATR